MESYKLPSKRVKRDKKYSMWLIDIIKYKNYLLIYSQ